MRSLEKDFWGLPFTGQHYFWSYTLQSKGITLIARYLLYSSYLSDLSIPTGLTSSPDTLEPVGVLHN
jgi:hypothetical protein